ncbi:hypothetical protein ILUMI_20892 [Ignelater luminosus]|uniref:PiggyBac transposable element-derived protein domain-containing protein n=1 Tax=Ignelater luminosus TaxID=2038154 RepID=A0A8K0G461_IGNLU|nr:hypothetical protein ILUMI_20892 [Ignelater luminosus]
MSGRRYEILFCCFNCTTDRDSKDSLSKVHPLLDRLLQIFRETYYPGEHLSFDEYCCFIMEVSAFANKYIKNKKTKYSIKFYELSVLNNEVYKGKRKENTAFAKINGLVLRPMSPYFDKGHHLVQDDYCSSLPLSNILLDHKTNSIGTLRSNQKSNPKPVTTKKLAKSEHIWKRNRKVYVTRWQDRRDVLCVTTRYHPQIVDVSNRYGQKKQKPIEFAEYNKYMSVADFIRSALSDRQPMEQQPSTSHLYECVQKSQISTLHSETISDEHEVSRLASCSTDNDTIFQITQKRKIKEISNKSSTKLYNEENLLDSSSDDDWVPEEHVDVDYLKTGVKEDFVLVKFPNNVFYVGQSLSTSDGNNDHEISYMKKLPLSRLFNDPGGKEKKLVQARSKSS